MKLSDKDLFKAFEEAESYLEMRMIVDLKGGNKAKMNKWIQNHFSNTWVHDEKSKVLLFIKQGITEKEIPLKFLWNMLGCPKSIDELRRR